MQNQIVNPNRLLQCTILGILSLLLFSETASAYDWQAVVKLKFPQGRIQGVNTEYGQKYLGIPYAESPVRWRAPQPDHGWVGIRDATLFAPHCAQIETPFGQPSTDEDCLYLNVYTPKQGRFDRRDYPVMVWIHGGALLYGLSDDVEPIQLVEQGVVVVTINYRLGALGFMAHPSLSAESIDGSSGNYGLMDQQMALQWVQKNIARFGGDPDNVTIFGESAGGHSVLAHITSPASSGLFHRAIIQSGTYALEQPTQQEWEMAGLGVMATAGCPDQDLDCMRALPVENILAAQELDGELSIYLTAVDGQLLPMSTTAAFASGQFNQVPIMDGTTRDEFMLFVPLYFDLAGNPVTPETYLEAVIELLGLDKTDPEKLDLANYIATVLYPLSAYDSPSQAIGAIGTDTLFSCSSLGILNMASQYIPTYAYEFNDPNAPQIFLPSFGYSYGAYHSSEIQYLMDEQRPIPIPVSPPFTPEQEALSDLMVRYWAQFAHDGDPNTAGIASWSPYNPTIGQITLQSLEPSTTQPISVMDYAAIHHCEFWASL